MTQKIDNETTLANFIKAVKNHINKFSKYKQIFNQNINKIQKYRQIGQSIKKIPKYREIGQNINKIFNFVANLETHRQNLTKITYNKKNIYNIIFYLLFYKTFGLFCQLVY